jgi:hypothetical protein
LVVVGAAWVVVSHKALVSVHPVLRA